MQYPGYGTSAGKFRGLKINVVIFSQKQDYCKWDFPLRLPW